MAKRSQGRPSNLSLMCKKCNNKIPYDPSRYVETCEPCQNIIELGASTEQDPMDCKPVQSASNGITSPISFTPINRNHGNTTLKSSLTDSTTAEPRNPVEQKTNSSMEDSEDEFTDAREELKSESDVEESGRENESASTDRANHERDGDGDAVMRDVDALAESDDEPDMFESTFGKDTSQDADSDVEEDKNDNDVEPTSTKTQPKESSPRNDLLSSKKSVTTREASTPSSSPSSKPGSSGPSPPPDPIRDLSPNLKLLRGFHNRAVELIPRLAVASHRYWIGVLHLTVSPKSFSAERHFTWMKGNRLTLVQTVWHAYQNATASENFVLLLGDERVGMKDRVEQLDYFNEKKVMFRAVDERSEQAKGRSLVEGLVPAVKGLEAQEKKALGEPVVIDIEDDD